MVVWYHDDHAVMPLFFRDPKYYGAPWYISGYNILVESERVHLIHVHFSLPPLVNVMCSKLFTAQDATYVFNIICLLLGIGSLSMAYSFAATGVWIGSIALWVIGFMNIYATLLLSQCFAHAPSYVETYSDLGMYVAGKPGKWLVQIAQFGSCLLFPVAYFVLEDSYCSRASLLAFCIGIRRPGSWCLALWCFQLPGFDR